MAKTENKNSISQWFNAEELNTLKGMEYLAQKVANEAISGLHNGKRLGQGTDFSQYKNYMPGDDLRQIDWKVYGRTDRLYLKESELESHSRWYGLLDASESMVYEEANISKWKYAKIIWAAIAYLSKKQGDSDGLAIINDKNITHLPPRAGFEKARMKLLFDSKTAGKWPSNFSFPFLKNGFQNKFILITDFYEQSNELGTFIRSLLPARNEVTVFHIMGENEMNLNFDGINMFEDAETGIRIETNTNQIKAKYQKQSENFVKDSRNQIIKWGAKYHLCMMPQSPVNVLKAFLNQNSG